MDRIYTRGDEPVPGFKLVKPLGRGGFGEVWKVTAPGGIEAALKIINLGNNQGLKEFRAIRRVRMIHHPNLVPVTAFWLKDQAGNFIDEGNLRGDSLNLQAQGAELLIAMGLGDKNLYDRLREYQQQGKTGIPADELLDYIDGAARAIDFLNQPTHELGSGPVSIQHCDIKPQNILIVGGAAQVCDFGLARVLEESRATVMAGSAAYMAPEMIRNNQPSRSTDQYSLAISYYELRTGFMPYDTRTVSAVLANAEGRLDFARLTDQEQAVLRRATALDPEKRFPATVEMVRQLRRAYENSSAPKPTTVLGLDELLQPGKEIVPGYKLVLQIGRGGYGEVWRATAPGGRGVALKVIRNLQAVQGKQEFRALELIKSVEHNHLMELHAYWLLDRSGTIIPDEIRDQPDAPTPHVLVMASKLARKNLLQRLQECMNQGQSGIPLPELLQYMRQAAKAIDYLNQPVHPLNDRPVAIQHRDIKPENILLSNDNTVKVGDFGLAKVIEGTEAEIHTDSTGLTLAYAAPEMFNGKVSNHTDQYSLALTYYKLRTGELPFDPAAPPYEVIKKHLEGQLDFSRIPPGERDVLLHASRVKPEERFASCSDMVQALAAACPDVMLASLPSTALGELMSSQGLLNTLPPPTAGGDFGSGLPDRSGATRRDVTPLSASGKGLAPPSGTRPLSTPVSPAGATASLEQARQLAESDDSETGTYLANNPGAAALQQAPTADTTASPQQPSGPLAASSADSGEDNEFKTYLAPAGGVAGRVPPDVAVEPIVVPDDPEPSMAHGVPTPKKKFRSTARAGATPTAGPDELSSGMAAKHDTTRDQTASSRTHVPPSATQKISVHGHRARRRRVNIRLVVQISVVFLVAVVLGAGAWWFFGGPRLRGQVAEKLDQQAYAEALETIKAGSGTSAAKEELRGQVLAAWRNQARKELKERNYEAAEKTAQELLDHDPDDTVALEVRTEALLWSVPLQVNRLIAEGNYEAALDKLATPGLDRDTRSLQERKVRESWNARVEAAADKGDWPTAERLSSTYLRRFPNESKIVAIRDRARTETVLVRLKGLIDRKDFKEATKSLPEVPEGLREEWASKLRQAWLDEAGKQRTDRKPDKVLKLLEDYAATFPEHAKAKDVVSLRKFAQQDQMEGRIEGLITARKFEDAHELLKLDVKDKVLDATTHQELHDRLLKAWLDLARDLAEQVRKDQGDEAKKQETIRTCDAILAAFPGNLDAKKIQDELTGTADAAIARLLHDGEKALNGKPRDAAKARKDFAAARDALRDKPKAQSLKTRAQIGLARANAQLAQPNWQETRDLLKLLPTEDLAAAEKAYKLALETLYAARPETKADPFDLLHRLAALRQMGDLIASLDKDSWEREHIDTLRAEVVRKVLERLPGKLATLALDMALQSVDEILLLDPTKLDRVVTTLTEVSDNLRLREDERGGLLNPPYQPASAERAARWLSKAQERLDAVKQRASTNLRFKLALASACKATPDLAEARQLLKTPGAKILAKEAGDAGKDVYFLLLAEAKEPKEADQARLDAYAEFLDLLKARGDSKRIPPVELYARVLAPAVTLGEAMAAKSREPKLLKEAAALCAAGGQLFKEHWYASWPADIGDPRQKALALYTRAVELEPQRVEYLVKRSYARLDLPGEPDWKLLEKEAKEAIETDKDYVGGHALLGYVMHMHSRRALTVGARVSQVREAIDKYNVALDMTKEPDGEKAGLLASLSMAELELGNLVGVTEERPPLLKKARDHAREATAIPQLVYPEYAWEALGNALEDIAWLLQEKDNYKEAIEAFKKASELRPDRPSPQISRARCYYRWVAFGDGDKSELLPRAKEDLEEVLTKPRLRPEERGEALYWRGEIALHERDAKATDQYLGEATKLADEHKLSALGRYALAWVRSSLDQARKGSKTQTYAVVRERANKYLINSAPLDAALLIGHSYQMEGDLKSAYKAYDDALKERGADAKEGEQFALLMARAECLYKGKFKDFPPDNPTEAAREDVKQALRYVDKWSEHPDTQAWGYGTAGLVYFFTSRDKKPAAKRQDEKEVIKYLTLAMQKVPKGTGDSYAWSFVLATLLRVRMDEAKARAVWEADKKLALDALTEGLKTCPESGWTGRLENLRSGIEEAKGP